MAVNIEGGCNTRVAETLLYDLGMAPFLVTYLTVMLSRSHKPGELDG